ncbi:MAG TPA: 4'-phosphopantetheinyl transferase superfamily protein [Rhodothermales bacterium]
MQLPPDVSYRWLRDEPDRHSDRVSILSPDERGRLVTFRADKRRHEFTLGRAAARLLLAERLGLEPSEVPLRVDEDGGLSVEGSDLHVSISHTARQAVAAVAHRPVGIDLETIKSLRTEIRHFIFHEEDYGLFEGLPLDEHRAQILAWALKEAALKARRSGLRFSPRRMRIALSLENRTALLEEDTGTTWQASFLEQDGLYLAIAYRPD